MNKKFFNAILFGALALSMGTFTSCKDYDDDIDALDERVDAVEKSITDLENAIRNGKWVTSYNAVSNGYELILSDGSKLVITNGKDGEKGEKGDKGDQGEQGIQGIQGIQGEKGADGTSPAAIVPKFKVDADGYWMVSVDEGETYVYVTDNDGNKICAKGEKGEPGEPGATGTFTGTVMTVGEDGYIYFGDRKSTLKFDQTLPTVIDNEKDQTIQLTIDGKSYTLLKEGSAYKGLQSIMYRKQAVDDGDDVAVAYALVRPATDKLNPTSKDQLFATAPAIASFKVYPGNFSLMDADLSFKDTYKASRSSDEPLFAPRRFSLTQEDGYGILEVMAIPSNDVEKEQVYKTSLDVVMYEQYGTASDYFNIEKVEASTEDLCNVFKRQDENNDWIMLAEVEDGKTYDTEAYGKFDFQGTYNLNDSIDAYIGGDVDRFVKYETTIDYDIEFSLLDENKKYDFNGTTIETHQGIFEVNEGVLSVKADKQYSAINEYAAIKITTTVKAEEEGVADEVIENVVYIKAVRPEKEIAYQTVQLKAADSKQTFKFEYDSQNARVIKLDVRDFEQAIKGRDALDLNNESYCAIISLYAPVYDETTGKLTGYTELNYTTKTPAYGEDVLEDYVKNTTKSNVVELYYKNGGNNADQDELYLIVGKSEKMKEVEGTLLLGQIKVWNKSASSVDKNAWGFGEYQSNGVLTPFGVYNEAESTRFKVELPDFAVTRNFSYAIKTSYSALTIQGEWESDKSFTGMQSVDLNIAYDIKPADAKVEFKLRDDQTDEILKLIEDGQITLVGNKLTLSPRVDMAVAKEIKLDIYDVDLSGKAVKRNDKGNESELVWKLVSPIKEFSAVANLTYKNSALAANDEIKLADLIKALTSSSDQNKWKNLKLTDKYTATGDTPNTLVKYDADKIVVEESDAEKWYRTNSESKGLNFTIENEDEDTKNAFTIDATTGTLTYQATATGAKTTYTVEVAINYVHNWGTTSLPFTVTVSRTAE